MTLDDDSSSSVVSFTIADIASLATTVRTIQAQDCRIFVNFQSHPLENGTLIASVTGTSVTTNQYMLHRELYVDVLNSTGDLDSTWQGGHARLDPTRPTVKNTLVNGLCAIIFTVLVTPREIGPILGGLGQLVMRWQVRGVSIPHEPSGFHLLL